MKSIILISILSLFLFLTCARYSSTLDGDSAPGTLELTVKLEPVGSLAKQKCIDLDILTITLTAPGEETIVDSTAISGNDRQTITKTFSNIASIKTWTATVVAKDKTGKTIYSGTTSFAIKPREMISVSLELAAMYSMLKANFFPIRDSVNACLLLIDGTIVADSAFGRTALRGDTVRLAYDYLTASTKGIQHAIRLDVRGIVWGSDTLLYRGDTVITVVSGQDATYAIKLKCMIKDAPPGIASMTVTLGAKGKVTINGEMEDHQFLEMTEAFSVSRQAHDSIQAWLATSSVDQARDNLVSFLNTQKNVKDVIVSDDSTVVSVEFMNGLEALALFGKPGTISYPGNNQGIAVSVSADVNGEEPGGIINRNTEHENVKSKITTGTSITMDELVDLNFKLPTLFTNLTNYGFIHIASHGGIDPLHNGSFFLSGDTSGFSSGNLEAWAETHSQYYLWWKEDESIIPDMVSELWAVKPAFIENLPGSFPGSLVILSFCKSMESTAMANAFTAKSAATVVGWIGSPDTAFAREAIDTLLSLMVDNAKTVSEACQATNAKMRTSYPGIKDSLYFAGDFTMQLPSTYNLIITNNGKGTTTPSGMIKVNPGVATSIVATSNFPFIFYNWSVVSGNAVITDSTQVSTTVTLNSNATINADFGSVSVTYNKTYSFANMNWGSYGKKIFQTPDNGFIIFGSAGQWGYYCFLIVKVDFNGNQLWYTTTYKEGISEYCRDGLQTSDGGFIAVGSTYHENNGHIHIVKTNSSGKILWEKYHNISGINDVASINTTQDGGYLISGDVMTTDINHSVAAWIAKINEVGDTLWTKTISGDEPQYSPSEMHKTSDGGFILGGESFNKANLIKLDALGNVSWNLSYPQDGRTSAWSIDQTSDNGYVITGHGAIGGEPNIYMMKTDKNGTMQWQTYSGVSGYGECIREAHDGGLIVTGCEPTDPASDRKIVLIKTDMNGSVKWKTKFGTDGTENIGYGICLVNDGGYIVAGYSGNDLIIIKTDENGNVR